VHLMINGHSDYTHWDQTYPPQMETVIMPASARQLLMAGVTSARDLGGPLKPILAVRDRIKKGELPAQHSTFRDHLFNMSRVLTLLTLRSPAARGRHCYLSKVIPT